MTNERKGSVVAGMMWMLVLSLLLFWLPVIGPILAGIVGGKKAGGVGAAILATFLPAIVGSVALFVFSSLLIGIPVIGAIVAAGVFVLLAAHVGPLLVGAIVGGLLA